MDYEEQDYMEIMEKNMETTIGIIGYILGFYWDNGKENGNYYSIIGDRISGFFLA